MVQSSIRLWSGTLKKKHTNTMHFVPGAWKIDTGLFTSFTAAESTIYKMTEPYSSEDLIMSLASNPLSKN